MSHNESYWNERASKIKDINKAVGAGTYLPGIRSTDFVNKSILRLFKKTNPSHCLDAGCGTGIYIPLLSQYFQRVSGLDFSPNMIQLAKDYLKEYKNIEFIVGSVTKIPIENNSVQNIFCKSTVQCMSLEDVELTLKEFKRILKPNGYLLIHVKNNTNLGLTLALFKRLFLLDFKGYSDLRQKYNFANYSEVFEFDKAYYRPLSLYFQLFKKVGFNYVDMFSYQCYSLKYLHKKRIAQRWETIELLLRKVPILSSILRKQGIDCYILLKKPSNE